MPTGYRKPETLLKLEKALYGLRESPLLWQRELKNTLSSQGFQALPHEPCCFIKGGILIFFYVDDIIVAYRKTQESVAQEAIKDLKEKYHLSGGHNLQWFLGIKVIRDRAKGLIWLS